MSAEVTAVESRTTTLLSHNLGLNCPSPYPISPFLLSKHLKGCMWKGKQTLIWQSPLASNLVIHLHTWLLTRIPLPVAKNHCPYYSGIEKLAALPGVLHPQVYSLVFHLDFIPYCFQHPCPTNHPCQEN